MGKKVKLYGMQELMVNMTKGNDSCVILPAGFRIKGRLDIKTLENAVQKLVDQSDAMRIVFSMDEKTQTLYQEVKDKYEFELEPKKCTGENEEQKMQYIREDIQKVMKNVSFLLDGDVKWKIVLYELGGDDYVLWIVMNHLISDGLSMNNAVGRIVMAYNDMPVPPAGDYMEYIGQQLEIENDPECIKKRKEYLETLKDLKKTVDSSSIGQTPNGYGVVSAVGTDGLSKFARENKMGLFHCSLFMYHAAVAAAFETDDTFIGIAVGTRKLKFSMSIGQFLSSFGHRVKFERDMSMHKAAVKCRDTFLKISRNDRGYYNDFKKGVMFTMAYQNFDGDQEEIRLKEALLYPLEDAETYMIPFHWASMCIDAYEGQDGICFMAGYDKTVFTEEIMKRMDIGFTLSAECLSGNDMTFGEFMDKVNERAGK